jgi:hypothetical protein
MRGDVHRHRQAQAAPHCLGQGLTVLVEAWAHQRPVNKVLSSALKLGWISSTGTLFRPIWTWSAATAPV